MSCVRAGCLATRALESARVNGVRFPAVPELSAINLLYTFAMSFRFRSVLMWLLLIALPVQGFAAATMLNCGPNHQQMWQASAAAKADPSVHAAHDHHHKAVDADAGEAPTAGQPSDDGNSLTQLNKAAKFKCSACAACCMGIALPASPLAITALLVDSAPQLEGSAVHVDFVSTGPDRPPRTARA